MFAVKPQENSEEEIDVTKDVYCFDHPVAGVVNLLISAAISPEKLLKTIACFLCVFSV